MALMTEDEVIGLAKDLHSQHVTERNDLDVLRRYVTGNGSVSWNLDRTAEWWWSMPISPLTVWAVTAVAFTVGVALLTAELTTPAPAAGEPVDAPEIRAGVAGEPSSAG